MTTITMKFRHALAALCLVACNGSFGDMTDGSEETSATNPTAGEEWMPCSAANACPDGQFCFNGLCALGCQSDGDCADNQYCGTEDDKLCHNKEVSTCPDVACAEGQMCVDGFCSTPPSDEVCMEGAPVDGCEANALCFEADESGAKCYTFPYCAQDGTCPVGTQGAVCNDGIIPEKDKICLVGLCTAAEHCPAEWFCVEFEANSVLGYCSNGGVGSVCSSAAECLSGNCQMAFPGLPGVCL